MRTLLRNQFFKKKSFKTSSMVHAQESRMSSNPGNFKISEESRSSGVSALVSRLNSSTPGADNAENEKSRGDSSKTKEQKMQDTFPWIPGLTSLCQATVGCRNVKALENLMTRYLENVTPSVRDCYSKAIRASKLKKNMKDVLIFFHLFYQEVKEALERSSYLDLMTPLVSMFMDMEIKASIRGKESLKKLASRLTSSLYLFLDNSEEHMLDAILMTKYVNKNYREICYPLLWKLLSNISNRKDDIFYVRYLLTFKLWKKIVPDPEERKRINKTAVEKLHAPPNLLENVKALGNVLPRIPKTKKNITLFLMQSNFNLKDACQEFLKSVKKTQKTVYSQSLGNVDIDKPLFFMSDSGSAVHLLSEKDVEVDSGHNSTDLWSSISVDSIDSPLDMVKELNSDPTLEVTIGSKKKRKLNKKGKKGKKKTKLNSGAKAKKKKKLKNSESAGFEKGTKKSSKLKAKKKKKKKLQKGGQDSSMVKPVIPQSCENSQIKVKQISSQIEEVNQVAVKSSSGILKEEPDQTNAKSPATVSEQASKINVKVDLAKPEESVFTESVSDLRIVEECKTSNVETLEPEPMKCDQLGENETVNTKGIMRLLYIPKTENDKSVISFENSKSDLFGDKPKDLINKEVEIPVDHPKSEKMETSSSSAKQILETSLQQFMETEVDETLIKTEKADVVSAVCVASQCDLNERGSSELMEQVPAHQMSSISIEKKVNEDVTCKPNKSTEESMLSVDHLATKSNIKEKADSSFDDQMANLFIVEKATDKSQEGKNLLNLPKKEKLDILHSPSKPQPSSQPMSSSILAVSISSKVDEPLVKKEKVEVVCSLFTDSVDSQFDRKVSTETREQVTAKQNSSITLEKNAALECAKPCIVTGEPVLTSDGLLTENKDKGDTVFENQKPNVFIIEKSKDESTEEVENLNVPISFVVEERGVNGYEKAKVAENSVPVSMYSVDMEVCNPSIKESCDNSETMEASAVTEVIFPIKPHMRAWAESKSNLEGSRGINHEICSTMSYPNSLYLSNQTNLSWQPPLYATSLKGLQRNSAPCGKYAEKAITSVCESALYNSESSLGQVNASASASTYTCSSSRPIGTDSEVEILEEQQETGKCTASPSEEEIVLGVDGDLLTRQQVPGNIFNHTNSEVVIQMLSPSYSISQNVDTMQFEYQPGHEYVPSHSMADLYGSQGDSFDSKTINKYNPCLCHSSDVDGMEDNNVMQHEIPWQWPFMELEVDEEEDEVDGSPKSFESSTPKRGLGKVSFSDIKSQNFYGRSGSRALPTNSSESGTSGSSSPRSESGTDSGGGIGNDSMEDCNRLVKTVGLSDQSDRISDESTLRFYNSSTYDKSPETVSCSKESFISQNSYESKVGDSHLGRSPSIKNNVGDSAVNKLSSRDSNRLEVSSSASVSESVTSSVEVSSSRRTKLHLDERVGSQMASSKHRTAERSVVHSGEEAIKIPVIASPSSTSGEAVTHKTQQKSDGSKERCICAECKYSGVTSTHRSYDHTQGSYDLKVSSSSFNARDDPPLKKMKSSSKPHPGDTVGSQITAKQGAGEFSMGQGRPSVRGQRRRGRPPGRGRGVSSPMKISSDTKSTQMQGSSRKGIIDPEYQVTQPKKSQQYDPPITRSISKKLGVSDIHMFG